MTLMILMLHEEFTTGRRLRDILTDMNALNSPHHVELPRVELPHHHAQLQKRESNIKDTLPKDVIVQHHGLSGSLKETKRQQKVHRLQEMRANNEHNKEEHRRKKILQEWNRMHSGNRSIEQESRVLGNISGYNNNATVKLYNVTHKSHSKLNDSEVEGKIKSDVNKTENVGELKIQSNLSERERLRHLERIPPENAPGEWGEGVTAGKGRLSKEERKKYDDLYKKNSFSQYVSDMISVHRRLKDTRNAR